MSVYTKTFTRGIKEKVVPQPKIKLSHQGEIKLVSDWSTTLQEGTQVSNKDY